MSDSKQWIEPSAFPFRIPLLSLSPLVSTTMTTSVFQCQALEQKGQTERARWSAQKPKKEKKNVKNTKTWKTQKTALGSQFANFGRIRDFWKKNGADTPKMPRKLPPQVRGGCLGGPRRSLEVPRRSPEVPAGSPDVPRGSRRSPEVRRFPGGPRKSPEVPRRFPGGSPEVPGGPRRFPGGYSDVPRRFPGGSPEVLGVARGSQRSRILRGSLEVL